MLDTWSPLFVASGVIEFACEALRRFSLDNYTAGVALRLITRAADEGPEALAIMVAHDAAKHAVAAGKTHPESSRVQWNSLYVVSVIDDDATRLACANDGVLKSAVIAYRAHIFSEHKSVSMSTVRRRRLTFQCFECPVC